MHINQYTHIYIYIYTYIYIEIVHMYIHVHTLTCRSRPACSNCNIFSVEMSTLRVAICILILEIWNEPVFIAPASGFMLGLRCENS